MIITIAAIALLSPAQVAEKTVVPSAPVQAVSSYDWKAQKAGGKIDSGSAYQTGSFYAGGREDWQAD